MVVIAKREQVRGQETLREGVGNFVQRSRFLDDRDRGPFPRKGVGGIAGMHDEGQVPVCEALKDGSGAVSAEIQIDDRSR